MMRSDPNLKISYEFCFHSQDSVEFFGSSEYGVRVEVVLISLLHQSDDDTPL